ncbi:MAG TPA: sugar phosphate isomerase/epimerase family protein [Bryobacteraceae bacterium]|nr:sugar phosphate isomerase/epimerase family protein [Bryobacteraceae bacterium]
MHAPTPRRRFLAGSLAAASALALGPDRALAHGEVRRRAGTKLKIGLNSYSFNQPLLAGKMTLDDVIDYCAAHGIDGLDPTGYYFPGYPQVPPDSYLFNLKKKAYLNGVTLSGTGVRNDFTSADPAVLKPQIQLVKDWVVAAGKMSAAFVRVFSGPRMPGGSTFDKVLETMVPAFRECAAFGKEHGVIIALQHHDDFLKTADQTIRVVEAVDSDWFSVVLDVGSVRQGDPYAEIEKLLPYACTWQIKEQVYFNNKAAPIDLAKIRAIIDKIGYRGFVPFEALGQGNPDQVTAFLEKVRKAMA